MASNVTPNKKGPAQPATYQPASYQTSAIGAAQRPAGATATTGRTAQALSHQQIADRARTIWKAKGCPVGRDEQNWLEAEAQLKKEQGIR